MFEGTDDDILETADRLAKELALTGDDRDVITLRIQRLVWPPSPWPFLHEGEHVVQEIGKHDGGGWYGELLCPHGCARRWRVNIATSRDAVHGALTAAHEEYRTGKKLSVESVAPEPKKVTLSLLGQRNEYVEVQDERLTAEKVSD